MSLSIMIPTYRYSTSSPMPIDLNEDQNLQFFSHHQAAYSSSSSLSYPPFYNYNPDQDQPRSHYWESNSKPSQTDEEADKSIPSGGSWDHHPTEKVERNMKLTVRKKEERDEENQAEHSGSAKWMSSKMRIMQKMLVSDQIGSSNVAGSSTKKFEDEKQPLSPLGTDNSSNSSSYNSNIAARVCSDCHTTKTPLWRSGPRGPKSLCNACGIRQRKARRAMAAAAAASANGTILAAEAAPLAEKKLQNKEMSKINGCSPQLKRKRKHRINKPIPQEREKFGFEDFRISLNKKLAVQRVFPQDEKEAAILLMALSYGLVHG